MTHLDDTSRSPRRPFLRRLPGTLSLRLFLLLFGVMVPVFAVYATFNIERTSARWQEVSYQEARSKSDLIKRSTHHGMLLNRKEDVHGIIQMIAEGHDVSGIRIYDKTGIIMFSADSAEIGRRVDLQAEACVICHEEDRPLRSVPAESRARVYRGADGGRVLGLINPIENARECSDAACHAHPADQTVLGVLDVKMSLRHADEQMAAAVREMIVATLVVTLLLGAVSAAFIFRMVRSPVRRLIDGTRRVAQGDLEVSLPAEGGGELGQLARAFNRMIDDLREARREITDWSQNLEVKVREKTEELGRAHSQIATMDKLASLGKLSATVAHELNNPLSGILTYARLTSREMEEGPRDAAARAEMGRYLGFIQKETARCGNIVRNLLLFARRSPVDFKEQSLNPIVERSLMLVRHHLEMAGIQLETELLESDDSLVFDGDLLQQALVALLINAVEAMPNGGTLRVGARRSDGGVELRVADTGVGIPEDVLPHVFEPFISTKRGEKAAGLGLAVVYGIVQQHHGRIDVESRAGQGTTIRIFLPAAPAGEETPAARRPDAA